MLPKLEDLVRIVKKRKIFKRNKKSLNVKVIAGLLYYFGLSTRKVSKVLSLFEEISHESVRKYYHSLQKVFKEPRKKRKRLIAVDETVLKMGKTLRLDCYRRRYDGMLGHTGFYHEKLLRRIDFYRINS